MKIKFNLEIYTVIERTGDDMFPTAVIKSTTIKTEAVALFMEKPYRDIETSSIDVIIEASCCDSYHDITIQGEEGVIVK